MGLYLHDVTEIVLLVSIPSNILLVDWYSLALITYNISYLILFSPSPLLSSPFPVYFYYFVKIHNIYTLASALVLIFL